MAVISIPVTEYKELYQELTSQRERAKRLEQEIQILRELLRLERIRKYGGKSEALNNGQLELLEEEPSIEADEIEKEAELSQEQKPVAKKREHQNQQELQRQIDLGQNPLVQGKILPAENKGQM